MRITIAAAIAFLCLPSPASPQRAPDYLQIVRAYADAMIEHGRDVYGPERTPLFASALDRSTMRIGDFPEIEGIREHDRVTRGSNPMHDQNLYQVLHALSLATGEPRYAAEADRALDYFFDHAQSPATGLLAWGEHLGWGFESESMIGNDEHEFYRPWVLWDRVRELSPEALPRFARGLWEHQIYDQRTGEFSRHASYREHEPQRGNDYPRHGGFYVDTWAEAYRDTGDPVFARATEVLLDGFERRRSPRTGAFACCSREDRLHIMWPLSNVSLAVDLARAAAAFPGPLRARMFDVAENVDSIFLALDHSFGPEGIGFVTGADIHTLENFLEGEWTHTEPWVTGYGMSTDAQAANLLVERLRQLPAGPTKDGYRALILASADRYLTSEPDVSRTIYPGSLGEVILHMLNAHELTGDARFAQRAEHFARLAVELFLEPGSALPKASTRHDHYEAITRADTMMMALLRLWQVRERPDLALPLEYTDR